jgi:hypothetical protein
MGEWEDSGRTVILDVPSPQAFIGVCGYGVVNSRKLGYVINFQRPLSTPPTFWAGKFLALNGQTKAIIFHKLWRLWVSNTLPFVVSQSANIRSSSGMQFFINIQAIVLSHRVS